MVFQLFVLEANQDGIENRISFFFAQCFRQEWAFQSFGVCTLHTKTEIIA